jgi:hypothetical protein
MSMPASTGLPSFFATRTLPMAMALVAMSSSSGGSASVPGMPMQTGLVEKRESLPRNGATSPRWSATLTKWMETRPAALASSP